jgi:hypothetical protein
MEEGVQPLDRQSSPENGIDGVFFHFPGMGVRQFLVARKTKKSIPNPNGRFTNWTDLGVQAVGKVVHPRTEQLFHAANFPLPK